MGAQPTKIDNQCITQVDDYLPTWLEAFLFDRKATGLAAGTVRFYDKKLELFSDFCDTQAIDKIGQVTPDSIRRYLLWLEEKHHNPGGANAAYRALKTFLYWWELEVEPEGWKNPIRKVKAPKVGVEPIEPVALETVKALLATCSPKTQIGARDRAILLTLIDTGVRAAELCAMNQADYDPLHSEILILKGKGRKPRTAFLSPTTRRALRAYLAWRKDGYLALWVSSDGRLTYWGLNEMIRRRAKMAGVEKPGLHDFRRAFCLALLRQGVDIVSISRLMGHADINLVRRYAKQTDQDLSGVHQRNSPVELMNRFKPIVS